MGLRRLWAWAAGAMLCGLSACNTPGAVTASTEFGPESADGVVILGVRRDSGLFERGHAALRFVRIDRTRALLIKDAGKVSNDFRIIRSGGRGVIDPLDRSGPVTKSEMFIYRVPPGDYYLYTAQWGDSGFQIMEKGSFLGTIGAGEIVYWGDVRVGVPEDAWGDLQLEFVELNHADAQATVDRYPSLRGPLVYRPLEPAQLACDLGDKGFIFAEITLNDAPCYGGST